MKIENEFCLCMIYTECVFFVCFFSEGFFVMIELESWRKFLIAEKRRMEDKHNRVKNGVLPKTTDTIPDTNLMPAEIEFKASFAALTDNAEKHETACMRMMIIVYARKLRFDYLKEALALSKQDGKFLVYTPIVTVRWEENFDPNMPEMSVLPDRIDWYENTIRTISGKRKVLKRRVKKITGDQFTYGRSCFPLADPRDYALIKQYENKFKELRKMIATLAEIKAKFKVLNNCLK